ncbi:MAG: hypothetical protein JXB36_03995 [Gammaproteobacteria bacterium]|nr:hypothetical protein [Gammaproteobacteria bacterium]
MPAPWLTVLVKTVPWVELARRSPEIIDASRKLLDKTRSAAERQSDPRARATPEQLAERVRLLEQRDVEHAKIVEQVVEQLQGVTDALQVVEVRTRRLTYLLGFLVVFVVAAGILLLATR